MPAPVQNPPTLPNYAGGGVAPASGTGISGGLSGPWFIEGQSLDVDYSRVPLGSLSSYDITLTGATVTEHVGGTCLLVGVKASVYSTCSLDIYNTSAFQQPQTFRFNAFSGDYKGNTYGALDGSTLGPVGNIQTAQPYYSRRLLQDSDVSTLRHADGLSYYAIQSYSCDSSSPMEATQFINSWEKTFIDSQFAGALAADYEPNLGFHNLYRIAGSYNTNKEDIYQIISLIDRIGTYVAGIAFYSNPVTFTNSVPRMDVGFPEYDIHKHDYSGN